MTTALTQSDPAGAGGSAPSDARRFVILRRPGVLLLVYAFRLLSALFIAGPFALAVGPIIAGYPRGDAVLFDSGGLLWLEALRLARGPLLSAALQGTLGTLVLAFAGLLPLAALIASLGRSGPVTFGWLAERAARPLGTMSLLFGAALLAQAIASAVILVVGGVLADKLHLTDPNASAVRVVAAAATVIVLIGIGIVHDLARVAAVEQDARFYAAVTHGWRAFKSAKVRCIVAYAVRALAMLLVVLVALVLAHSIGVERGSHVVLAWLVHQSAILVTVALRASWLAEAIAICGGAVPAGQPALLVQSVPDVQAPPPADPDPLPVVAQASVVAETAAVAWSPEPSRSVALDAEPSAGNVAPPGTS
jgi:hypothetical protein